MRIFIAGPMTGYPEWNFPAFMTAEQEFFSCGHDVCNPARLFDHVDPKDIPTWEECMRITLAELIKCTGIVALDGWEKSEGACMEVFLAKKLKMKFFNIRGKEITDDIITPILTIGGVIK